MKKNLKFLLLAPFLMAILCESDDDTCGFSEPDTYIVNVENSAETYIVGETIWLNSQVSSELSYSCNDNNDQELVLDNTLFLDGLFILKLNNSLTNLNAQVSQDFTVAYDIGAVFFGNYCSEFFEYLPELSDDNLTYNYRLGISMSEPGDYCIVNARNSFFNLDQENNAQVFTSYNTLDDTIKFENCGVTYTRNGTQGYYFFTIQ
jgi:hypothetical protein